MAALVDRDSGDHRPPDCRGTGTVGSQPPAQHPDVERLAVGPRDRLAGVEATVGAGRRVGHQAEQATLAREALNGALQGFSRELVSSLQFYQSQPDSLGIREVVLAGGTARLAGLAPALQRLVGVNVRVGDPLVGISVGKKLKGGTPDPSLAVPIGLGMAL